MPEDITMAELARRIDDVKDEVIYLRNEQASSRSDNVSRKEWEQRNQYVNERFQEIGREIGTMRTLTESRFAALNGSKAPWWAVAPVIASVVAILITLIEKIGA